VAARIYDPQRAMVYQRLGIPTVATVRWTADQMIQRLLPQGAMPELTDPSGKVVIAEVPLAEAWIGHPLYVLEEQTGARVAYVTRLGEGVLPRSDMVVQQGDLVHMAVLRDDLARVERLGDSAPAPH
jgi:trk system potassium uptake protein TrkA